MTKKSQLVSSNLPPGGEHVEVNASEDPSSAQAVTGSAFPIVGIGASAGGLEALEAFFKNVPPNSGMAYIVIQHLDPTHTDIMAELLQRATLMRVSQITDRVRVEPGCVYVIPPNKDLSILHGVLHLLAPAAPRGLRLPIDYFFRSLADDQQERSVGVILSGMGSDGTLGLRAIKERNGAVFVQLPDSAKFAGKPRSAIDAGLVDVVAPVEELPEKIASFFQHAPFLSRPDLVLGDASQSSLEKILILLRAQTGQDFSLYKKNTIYRRIERRMSLHQIDRVSSYVRFLQENPHEIELLFKELLIGVTSFFRDPPAWEQLKNEVVAGFLTGHLTGGGLRAWTPGCSTGEEAYSLAMIFKEAIDQVKPARNVSLQIFATDLDKDAIEKARVGFYPANIAADVSSERLRRFFVQEEHGYRVGKEIREMVVFAPHNLVMDAPFTRLDLLICRNLLIYLSGDLQKKLLPLFHYSLNPGGILFLGSAETIGGFGDLFAALDGKNRLYRRSTAMQRTRPVDFPAVFLSGSSWASSTPSAQSKTSQPSPNLQTLVEQQLLRRFAPPGVLVNDKGDILYISGRTGKYLEPAAGKANLNIFAMAREGLRYELSGAFQKVLSEKAAVTVKNVVVGTNGGSQVVDVTLQPMAETGGLQGTVLIVFNEVAASSAAGISSGARRQATRQDRTVQIEQELKRARDELQSAREQMQTSQEELISVNEELQSANEELQSTNEELTTSKEELQSLNEELQTVNHELQARVDDLSRSNNDMKNLLNSTDIATLFLDDRLCVRRFTSQAAKIIKLIPGDAGRPITDIASDLLYPDLAEDVQTVLRTLIFKETSVLTRDGRWFTVRIMPYCTLENRIDGVVITFLDVSLAKKLELVLRESESEMKALLKYMPDGFVLFETVFDAMGNFCDCRFVYLNDACEQMMGMKNDETRGKTIREVWPKVESRWLKIFEQVATNGVATSFQMDLPHIGNRYRCNVYRPGESQDRFCLICEDIDASGLGGG